MKRHVAVLVGLLLVLLALVPAAPANAYCEESQDIFCGLQCGNWGSGGIWCAEDSDRHRCCFDSGVGGSACGEATNCPECGDCLGVGLF